MEELKGNTKKRKWQQLTERDRYKIEAYIAAGQSKASIAKLLGKSRRTIQREIKMGLTEQKRLNPSNSKSVEQGLYITEWVYLADAAQRIHDERAARKGRGLKIGHDLRLADFIEKKIKEDKWSPDATIGRIKADGMQFEVSICTKTVYNYIDTNVFRELTNKDLLRKRNKKKRSYKKIRKVALNNVKGTSISERPDEANERTEKGHWEIDLVVGKQGTKPVILTLVERLSRKSIYILARDKTQEEIIHALERAQKRVGGDFNHVFKTITADNGSEFLNSEGIKRAGKCDEVYYAHPYSSWERGSNENGNSILRRFIPKGTDLSKLTQRELRRIEDWVNNYPRRILGYRTANEVAAGSG